MTHIKYMQLAFEQAKLAQSFDEVPVGAVLVLDDKVIATEHNSQIRDNNPSSHAEINALKTAGQILGNYRLDNAVLYTTLEPCTMCFGAMVHARIAKVVFAANDKKTGVCGGCMMLARQPCFNHKIEVISGIMVEECSKLLSNFFKQKR